MDVYSTKHFEHLKVNNLNEYFIGRNFKTE